MSDKTINTKHILVVEDDPFIRDCVMEILEEEGFRAIGAGNGREAMDILQGTPTLPCLILLDLMMPVMDGWQFRSELELDGRIKTIPLVVVTADGNAHLKAKKINAAGWVKKPIEIDMLLKVVRNLCT